MSTLIEKLSALLFAWLGFCLATGHLDWFYRTLAEVRAAALHEIQKPWGELPVFDPATPHWHGRAHR